MSSQTRLTNCTSLLPALPVPDGGTGQSEFEHGLLMGNGTESILTLPPGANGAIPVSENGEWTVQIPEEIQPGQSQSWFEFTGEVDNQEITQLANAFLWQVSVFVTQGFSDDGGLHVTYGPGVTLTQDSQVDLMRPNTYHVSPNVLFNSATPIYLSVNLNSPASSGKAIVLLHYFDIS